MKDVTVRELFRSIPTETVSEVRVRGWVRTCRESKTIAFIELNDGSFFNNLQIVVEESAVNNFADALKRVSVGASVECVGDIVPTPEMKQPFEMKASSVTVLGDSPVDYPLQKKRHTVEYLRTIQVFTFFPVRRCRSVSGRWRWSGGRPS